MVGRGALDVGADVAMMDALSSPLGGSDSSNSMYKSSDNTARETGWPETDPGLWNIGLALGAIPDKQPLLAREPLSRAAQELLCARITQLPGGELLDLLQLIRREQAGVLAQDEGERAWEFDAGALSPELQHSIAAFVEFHLGCATPDLSRDTSASPLGSPLLSPHNNELGRYENFLPPPMPALPLPPPPPPPTVDAFDLDAVSPRMPQRRFSAMPPVSQALPNQQQNQQHRPGGGAPVQLSSSAPASGLASPSGAPGRSRSSTIMSQTNKRTRGTNTSSTNASSTNTSNTSSSNRPELQRGALLETISGIKVFAPEASPDKPANIRFMCDQCGKGFRKRSEVVVHLRVHTGERPLQCKFCDARFAHPSNRRSHERMHSEAALPCPVPGCGKVLRTTASLKEHVLGHESRFKRPCAHCGHRFRSDENLQKHMQAAHPGALAQEERTKEETDKVWLGYE